MPPHLKSHKARIAVVGGGVAGIHAAYRLQNDFEVVLFEAEPDLGGHAFSVPLPSGNRVDTGFMVFNEKSYPRFMEFLTDLGVSEHIQFSEMSFSILNEKQNLNFCLNRGLSLFFHQKWNLVKPSFYRNFLELMRFRKKAWRDLNSSSFPDVRLREYVSVFSPSFLENVLLPICISVWSVKAARILEFPAKTVASFLANHGYLQGHPGHRWRSLNGSSQVYVKAFEQKFSGKIITGKRIKEIRRCPDGVFVDSEHFDAVVCALPANRVLEVIKDPNSFEQSIFSKWEYEKTLITLHSDSKALGKAHEEPALWSSWNILNDSKGTSVTYYLNRVQSLNEDASWFVTLGSAERIDPEKVLQQTHFSHPIFNFNSVSTQVELNRAREHDGIIYCGSYFGYGFHEDAINSALEASRVCLRRFSGSSPES